MKKNIIIWLAFISFASCSDLKTKEQDNKNSHSNPKPKVSSFHTLSSQFDTLIPLLDGLFITHNNKKWGVVDSNGAEIIPFELDGVKQISSEKGLASTFASSLPLNTSFPRYIYGGKYFFFTKEGITEGKKRLFNIQVEGSGSYNKDFVIQSGTNFFLPDLNDTTKTPTRSVFQLMF